MAWFGDTFGDGLSTLKGQITKITKEVLSDDPLAATSFEGRIKELEQQCAEQLTEIETLRRENQRLKEGNSVELSEDQVQQICEYENRIAELTAEKTELTEALDRIEEDHQKELEIVIQDRDDLRDQLTNCQQPVPADDSEIQQLNNELSDIRLKNDVLSKENKTKDLEIVKCSENNQRLQERVAELELQLNQESVKARESFDAELLKKTIQDLERKLEDKNASEADLADRLKKLLEENAGLKRQLEVVQRDSPEEVDENSDKQVIESLQSELQESKGLCQRLAEENEKLQVELKEALSVKDTFESNESVLNQKLEETEETINRLTTENQKLSEKIANFEASAEDCSKLREEYEDKLNSMATLVQRTEERENLVSGSLASEIRVLKTLVSRIRSEFLPPVDLQTENTDEVTQSQTDDVKRLLQDVSQMTEIIKTINQGLSAMNADKVRLQKEVEVLKSLSTKTEHELSTNIKAKQQLEANVLEWAAAVASRDELINNLSAEKAANENRLTAENNILTQTNQQLLVENERLVGQLSEANSRADEWKSRLDGLQAIYDSDSKRAEELNKNKDQQLLELRKNLTENEEPGNVHNDQMSRLLDENSDLKTLVQQLRENIFAMNTRDVNKNPQQHRRSHSQTDDITTEARYQALVTENQSLIEKENNLRREVERLRAHLVDVEDHYTEQAVTTETQLTEYRKKLAILEDQLRNSSNVYKSANVRSSQQVEALQTQINLMDVQRKDLQNKLSQAEDDSQKQAAALASLQLVLEQFQLDKKREFQVIADKHAYQIELERRQIKETENELEAVRQQLTEAKNGLKAALRLGEQLEKKSQLVTELQEELKKVKEELSAAEKKMASMSQSTAGKIDKSIIKNLVVGYLTAQGDHKSQALKILSSVLELTQEERLRTGIEGQSGWLSHLLSPSSGSSSQGESLSQAFVRFLESESRPQPQLKLLPEPITPAQQKRTPLVLSDLVLPSVTPTPVSDNGLGQVLKDS